MILRQRVRGKQLIMSTNKDLVEFRRISSNFTFWNMGHKPKAFKSVELIEDTDDDSSVFDITSSDSDIFSSSGSSTASTTQRSFNHLSRRNDSIGAVKRRPRTNELLIHAC
jgi:hypothetical protein